MNIENLKTAVDLFSKRQFVDQTLIDLKDSVISIGGTRMDKFSIHDRLERVLISELSIIKTEIDKQIEDL